MRIGTSHQAEPPMLNRRRIMQLGVSAATIGARTESLRADDATPVQRIIDTNVHLFRWPFRRLPLDNTSRLVGKLRS